MVVLAAVFGLLSLQVLVPRQFPRVCHSVNMECGVRGNHVAVVTLHNCGKFYYESSNSKSHLKFCKYSSIGQLNLMRNSGGLNTGLNQDA